MGFKVNDIIRIADESDPAYRFNHLYKVLAATETGYRLESLTYKCTYEENQLLVYIRQYLVDSQGYDNVKAYIDDAYRLVTPTERLLYGRE